MRLRWAIAIVAAAAPSVLGQQPSAGDPEAVLKSTRERLLADLVRLPRYTCVQTITRRYYRAPQNAPASCARLIEEHATRQNKDELRLLSWDRLRLEVAIVEGQNVFSWVGAAKFESGNLEELAGRGPLGSGDFGSFLDSILRRADIGFQEETAAAGRRLLEYSYDMPAERSSYLVKRGAGWAPTAYSGSFLLDPSTSDIVSLTVRTAELPGSNPACQAISEDLYGRTMIHDRMILIPRETRLTTIDRTGGETHGVTAYENCREYASKSRILESAPSDAPAAAKPQPAPPAALSPDLRFQCRIVTPIDSDTAAAGDPIEGVLRSPIHDKKNSLLVPGGARLRGRLLLVEHRSGAFNTIRISVQWESIEIKGRDVLLQARPESLNRVNPIYAASDAVSLGAQTFVFSTDHLHLQHFDWTWVTQASKAEHASGSPAALPRTVEIAETEFPIAAAGAVHLQFSVPAGASGVRLEGTVSVSGGGAKNIAVSLFTSKEFAKMQNQEPATALYESGRTKQAALDVPLPSDAATYYLVFSNDFPLSTPKVVQASLRLHYMYMR